MSEWQAWCLGAKVGDAKPTQPEAWQEAVRIAMALYPEDQTRRRAFEDLCVMARVVPLSSTPESATAVPITGSRFTMEKRTFGYHYAGASR